jgi:hypothetical protein
MQHFITRTGHKLMDGDQPFRFMGANMPGISVPYDFTLFLPARLNLPTPWEQEDAFQTLVQMNLRVVRCWVLPVRRPDEPPQPWHYVLGPGQFNADAYVVLDQMLALANRYGVRVVMTFSAEQDHFLGGFGTLAAHRGKTREQFWTDPQCRDDYKAIVAHMIGRTNTITGVPYRLDKAIFAWQFGNEMYQATEEWISAMAAYIKQLDPNHLVMDTRHHLPAKVVDPNVDIYVRHLYPDHGDWIATINQNLAMLNGERPLVLGEYGPYNDSARFPNFKPVEAHARFIDFIVNEPTIAGGLIWSMYFHHRDGGFNWHQVFTYSSQWSYHWPGFASAEAQFERTILNQLRESAFRMAGQPVMPVPKPSPPALLPFNDVPMFSWRGSAGATGYDIERAAQPAGPWTKIARDVSDADVAYRPLFSDTTAKAGEVWHYRVIARNQSGESAPSDVVGPVTVKQVCLADDLQDLRLAAGKSAGLTINNAFNGLYAEYLFRAKGDKGDWLSYQVPGQISSIKVVAFFAAEPAEFSLGVSADGQNFLPLTAQQQRRDLPNPPRHGVAHDQKRTLVEYTATVPRGQHWLRITWPGPAEVDRVEIYHSGGS